MKTRKTMKRRAFVKASGLAAGSVIMAPSLVSAKGFNQMDDAIKIGLIGCGGRGTGAAVQALMSGQHVQLVAMADAFADNIEKSLNNIKNAIEESEVPGDRIQVTPERQFAGFDAYQKLIPLCDVVVIATPPGFRPTHFEAAVKAGKHIFMEKPVAVDAPGVRRVLAAAQEAKRKKLNVVVGLQRHYEEQYLTWVELLQEGAIGDIHTSRVYWNSGGVWVRERQPGMTEMEYQMRNWYYFNWLCGDHITEQHIHNLDVGNWVKQAYPVAAYGTGGRLVRTGKEHGEIFDHHIVEFEYADGSRMFSQCRHMPGTDSRVTEAFQGSNGSAPKPGLILTKSGHTLYEYKGDNPNPYQVEHNLLFEAIVKGEYKFEDATNAANSTMTSILGRMATYSGQLIKWEDAINSELDLSPAALAWDANPPILPNADGYYPVAVPGETKVL
jgi:myo-inositol 2-dehydrogenase/D-chiro-inositol 1-dehydrogenase